MRVRCVQVAVPESNVILVEGIYALYPTVQPFIDLRVAISGAAHPLAIHLPFPSCFSYKECVCIDHGVCLLAFHANL